MRYVLLIIRNINNRSLFYNISAFNNSSISIIGVVGK